MYQLRSNEGRLERFDTFEEAYKKFEAQWVDDPESGSDTPEFWEKLSWTVEGNIRVMLYDDSTYVILTPDNIGT